MATITRGGQMTGGRAPATTTTSLVVIIASSGSAMVTKSVERDGIPETATGTKFNVDLDHWLTFEQQFQLLG